MGRVQGATLMKQHKTWQGLKREAFCPRLDAHLDLRCATLPYGQYLREICQPFSRPFPISALVLIGPAGPSGSPKGCSVSC